MSTRKSILALCLGAAAALAVNAQTSAPAAAAPSTTTAAPAPAAAQVPDGGMPKWIKDETPEQRKTRLGTNEDPGIDPDPAKHFWRYGHSFHIEKTDRRWANFEGADEGWVRPIGFVNVFHEIYQMNDKYVWAWMPDPDPNAKTAEPEPEMPMSRYTEMQLQYWQKMRSEFAPLDVPTSNKTVVFEDSSQGLPAAGSWRNSLAIADMNDDGFVDVIAPPERGVPNGVPAIFLGDGKGHWAFWKNVNWPNSLDYGSVAAGDFNKDGHTDLAFGVHLTGVFVFLGDGKGNFINSSEGLPTDFPTRRVTVADVDHDGALDVIAISEGPTGREDTDKARVYGRLRVFYNRMNGKKWEGVNVSDPLMSSFGGDWLAVGKFNSDAYPDFAAASIYFNGSNILYLSNGQKKYENVGGNGTVVPFMSYYFANGAGRFSSKTLDDAVITYYRDWPLCAPNDSISSTCIDPKIIPTPPATQIAGIDRIVFTGKEPKRVPLVRWGDKPRAIWGLGTGDFDGDGNQDLIYTRSEKRRLEMLLGDGKGNFTHAAIEGIKLELNITYDIKVADVNGDGKPDVIMAYESGATTAFTTRDGSIHVYLNRGTTTKAKDESKTAAK